MSRKTLQSVRRPERNFAVSDVRKWWFAIILWSRRVVGSCRDFYLYKTIWLEVFILLFMATIGGYLLYYFLYAKPEVTNVPAEKVLELDISSLEALRLWDVVRERDYAKNIAAPGAVFSP